MESSVIPDSMRYINAVILIEVKTPAFAGVTVYPYKKKIPTINPKNGTIASI